MAIRNIVREGDEILSKVCRPVEKFDEKLAVLLDDMAETLKKADGCGLAAPQVGVTGGDGRLPVLSRGLGHHPPAQKGQGNGPGPERQGIYHPGRGLAGPGFVP